ncbi:MAG TPA: SLC13 family permease [Vicinamibacterales bacterium]
MTATASLRPSHIAGLAAGVAALIAGLVLPPPAPITDLGMARLGLLAFAIIWWLATPLPLPMTTVAMLGAGVATGALSVSGAFAHSGSWVLWFVMGSFGIATALETTGLNRRVALAFLDAPWARGSSGRFLMMFLASATAMSILMANTIVAVVWLALAVRIYALLSVEHEDPLVESNTLGIAWAANIGGIASPISNGTNVVAMGMTAAATGVGVTFLQWTLLGTALTLVFLASALALFWLGPAGRSRTLDRPEVTRFVSAERRSLGTMTVVERWAAIWMGIAIGLWFLPDLVAAVAPGSVGEAVRRSLHMTVPALLVPIAMCVLPVPGAGGARVLTWDQWMRGVDWPLLLFVGGVMGLGTAVGEEVTGVGAFVRTAVEPWLAGLSEYAFVLAMSATVIAMTALLSNMVALTILLPLGISIASGLGIADSAAVGLLIGIGISLDYSLPSGTTTNAIVAGSGYLRVATMIRYGVPLSVIHAVLLTFVGYPLAKLILRGL